MLGCEARIKDVKNENHLTNPTITNWVKKDDRWQINTFCNIDFDKISWDNVEEIKFFLYFGTRLIGTAESNGINLDNLLIGTGETGVQVINCNFYNIKEKKQDDGLFIRSYCNIEYPETPNYLKVTVLERKDGKHIRYTVSNNKYKNES